MKIISRSTAIASGLNRYFTGKPCKHGHLAERICPDGACIECKRILNSEHYYRYADYYRKLILNRYHENPEPTIARVNKWVLKNRDKVRTNHRNWSRKNPDKILANTRNQRSRRLAAPGRHTAQDIQEIYAQQKGRCIYCKCNLKKKYHVDHIVALINGGSNDRSNLQITCKSCNHKKHAKDPIDFAREIGILI